MSTLKDRIAALALAADNEPDLDKARMLRQERNTLENEHYRQWLAEQGIPGPQETT